MGFTELTEYSEGSLPECGVATPYHYCSNTASYKPLDVSGLAGEVSSQFQAATESVSDVKDNINGKIDNLNKEWGTKFAAIDGNDLGIVDSNSFGEDLTKISNDIADQQSKCEQIISKIVSKTEEVNQYLSQLDETFQNYEQTKTEYDDLLTQRNDLAAQCNASTDQGTINSLKGQIDSLDSQLDVLEQLLNCYVDIQEPDGSWIVGA